MILDLEHHPERLRWPASDRQFITYPLVLLHGPILGHMTLPDDLRQDEADRICAMVRSLVIDEAEGSPAPPEPLSEPYAPPRRSTGGA
jgi:hypothetical protein